MVAAEPAGTTSTSRAEPPKEKPKKERAENERQENTKSLKPPSR